MAPKLNRSAGNIDPHVLYFLVDSRFYRKNIRPYKKLEDFNDNNGLRQFSNGFAPQRKIVVLRARILTTKCFPNKSRKSPSNNCALKQKDGKKQARKQVSSSSASRPTILLPPMECTLTNNDPANTAPVRSAKVQERTPLQLSVPIAPSAPSPGEVFYNSEDNSDIAFIVGDEEWRFPAHSFIMSKMERTLNALLESAETNIQVENQDQSKAKPSIILRLPLIQPNVFEQMLRYIYTRQVSLSSVESALTLLHPSHAYYLPELSSLCLSYVSKHLSSSNVLRILSCMLLPPPSSCISNVNGKINSDCQHDVDNQQNELVLKCFQVLDHNADVVLQSEDFETLNYEIVLEILKRDTLEVSSEAVVFDALMKWACRACKRQRKELTSANKCDVLGNKGLFLVRYLLMSPEEFLRGPVSHGVLSKDDKEALLSRISGDNSSPLPDHWNGLKLSVKRQCKDTIALSTTSSSDKLSSLTPLSPSSLILTQDKNAAEPKKKSISKKFLHGVGDLVICVIQLLD